MERKFFIKAKEKSIEDLIKNIKYTIPVYQRPYSWGEKEIKRLIRSIFEGYTSKNNEETFVGTIQINLKKINQKEIIDGQQRLTTLMIILLTLDNLNFQNDKDYQVEFKWFDTKVNNGSQETHLQNFLNNPFNLEEKDINPYVLNANLIKELLTEKLKELNNEKENIESKEVVNLIAYIKEKLFFIVLETKTELSKTLKIFDTINSTGLDLNGADIFKVRFYEYLKENLFEEIAELYKRVDFKNKKLINNSNPKTEINREQKSEISFNYVLTIYKEILISKYNLSDTLFSMGTDTFFEKLFDVLLCSEKIEHFNKEKCNKIKLKIEEIEKIIDIIFQREENICYDFNLMRDQGIISWSRYGIFNRFLLIYRLSPNYCQKKEEKIINLLARVLFLNSIIYRKQVYHVKKDIYKIMKQLYKKNDDANIDFIIKDLEELLNNHWKRKKFIEEIQGDITSVRKNKDLLCRFSSLSYEIGLKDINKLSMEEIREIRRKIFSWKKIDIEHIQSYNDEDNKGEVQNEWRDTINSLGNLMMLESSINRSIGNNSYPKKITNGYYKSEYEVVKHQILTYKKWTKEDAEKRKTIEIDKVKNYIFS